MSEPDDKSDLLYRLLEDASRRVKEWPEWKRSEDSRRERLKLIDEDRQKEAASGESD